MVPLSMGVAADDDIRIDSGECSRKRQETLGRPDF